MNQYSIGANEVIARYRIALGEIYTALFEASSSLFPLYLGLGEVVLGSGVLFACCCEPAELNLFLISGVDSPISKVEMQKVTKIEWEAR